MDIVIDSEMITLTQFLKMTDFIGSGGEAKYFLSEQIVLVNGEPEQRRGRKLHPGDKLQIGKQTYQIQAK